jgi:hypothetical protein
MQMTLWLHPEGWGRTRGFWPHVGLWPIVHYWLIGPFELRWFMREP